MSDTREQLAEHLRFYGDLGVAGFSRDPSWSKRPNAAEGHSSDIGHRISDIGSGSDAGPRDAASLLALIKADIGPDCPRCKLATLGRKQVVCGVGNPDADLMFVGEAPGADEDIKGIPFVGKAGELLTKMILAINLERDQVYIANVIKCRPPGNRNPEPDEIATCEPFLFQQIDAVRPRVIVALGAVAVPVPGLGALTYTVPDGMPDPLLGARVLVPLGNRTLTGIVVGSAAFAAEPLRRPKDPGQAGSRPESDPAATEDGQVAASAK